MMADVIITRTSGQCRTHHQKMVQGTKNKTLEEAIFNIKRKYEPKVYQDHTKKYMILFKTIADNYEKFIKLRGDDND